MGLVINHTFPQIGMETTPGRLEINSQKGRLEMHSKQPKVEIETELPKVHIDQYEPFSETGRMNVTDLIKQAAQNGLQAALEFIGKKADDGDALASLPVSGNTIADIAERDSSPDAGADRNITFLPTSRPKFTVTGSVKLMPQPTAEGIHNGVDIDVVPGNLNINYTPGSVRTYLLQKGSLEIRFEGSKIDKSV